MLVPLNRKLEKRGHKFARYADDFTIIVSSQRAGECVLSSISKYLENKLKLTVNTSKIRVVKTSDTKWRHLALSEYVLRSASVAIADGGTDK